MSEDNLLNFSNDAPREFQDVIPGKYQAYIAETPVIVAGRTNANTMMVKIQWKISKGQPCEGRVVFENIIIRHENDDVASRGRGRLVELLQKCNHEDPTSSSLQLWTMSGLTCVLKLGMSKGSDQYPSKIEVKGYEKSPVNGDRNVAVETMNKDSGNIPF